MAQKQYKSTDFLLCMQEILEGDQSPISSAILLALSSECTQKRMYSSPVVPSREGALRGRMSHISLHHLSTCI